MANEEQLAILRQGARTWNAWRKKNVTTRPDLEGADLRGADLIGASLESADLRGADLRGANLTQANLTYAVLMQANLTYAVLTRADLYKTDLSGAILLDSDLTQADLTGVGLLGANLTRTVLAGADFQGAYVGATSFGDLDFRTVHGLETVQHYAPSTIGIDTIYRSKGNIPKVFLRGCGVPDTFMEYVYSLTVRPIDYYSCFISYASKDQACVERLYTDLRAAGVRCWYAPEDLKIGERIRVGIDESIRLHDKLLLVLSKHSVASDWVEKEVETAMEQERQHKRTVLFPVRLDDAVMNIETGWPADIRRGRNIGDFRKWKQNDDYQKAFQRLLRDLTADDRGTA